MFKNIADVVPGDIIIDSGNRTTVTKVEIAPGSCKTMVHINQRDCYHISSEVRVQDNNKESQNA